MFTARWRSRRKPRNTWKTILVRTVTEKPKQFFVLIRILVIFFLSRSFFVFVCCFRKFLWFSSFSFTKRLTENCTIFHFTHLFFFHFFSRKNGFSPGLLGLASLFHFALSLLRVRFSFCRLSFFFFFRCCCFGHWLYSWMDGVVWLVGSWCGWKVGFFGAF